MQLCTIICTHTSCAYSCTAMHYSMADSSCTVNPEHSSATCNWCAAPWSHHADSATTTLVARAITSPIQDRCPGLPVSTRQCTDVSGRRCQLISDVSTRRLRSTDTAMCVVRRSHNTFSDRCFTTAGPRLWTRCPLNWWCSRVAVEARYQVSLLLFDRQTLNQVEFLQLH